MAVTCRIKIDPIRWQKLKERAANNSASVKRAAYNKAYGIFASAKRSMLAAFDRHLVTLELQSGPTAGINMSGTLEGYGNLFSFIGFHEGDTPTEPLRWLLEQSSMRQTVFRNGKWYFKVTIPDMKDVASVTLMPWEIGNSWAEGVEKGISGLSHYMYKRSAASRSGMGIQLPYENMEDAIFQPVPYMTEILANFRERVNTER